MCVCVVGPVGMLNGSISHAPLLADKTLGSAAYQLTLGMNAVVVVAVVVATVAADVAVM